MDAENGNLGMKRAKQQSGGYKHFLATRERRNPRKIS